MSDAVAVTHEGVGDQVNKAVRVLRFERSNPVRAYVLHREEGPVVIDSGVAAGKEAFLAQLDRLEPPPALLALTHGDGDHVCCAAAVVERYGCPVACHEDEGDRLRSSGLPVNRTFSHRDELIPGVRVIHTPGHLSRSPGAADPQRNGELSGGRADAPQFV